MRKSCSGAVLLALFVVSCLVAFSQAQPQQNDMVPADDQFEGDSNFPTEPQQNPTRPVVPPTQRPQQQQQPAVSQQSSGSNAGSADTTKPGVPKESDVNAGNIKVVLKKATAVASSLTEGIKYKIYMGWDMTFSEWILRSGFRFTVNGSKYIRYAIRNRLRDPFALNQFQRWFSEDGFTLDKQHPRLQTIEVVVWFVTKNGQRWESSPIKVPVSDNKGFFGLGKDNV